MSLKVSEKISVEIVDVIKNTILRPFVLRTPLMSGK